MFNKKISQFLILLALVSCFTTLNAKEISGEAPNFTLKSNTGKNLKLSEKRGQIVLINFWASWCGPCRQEMPELQKLYIKYKDLGFTVFGVNVEEESVEADKIVKADNITFPILYDNENEVSKLYDVKVMPSTVIVDRNGQSRFLHQGYKPGDIKKYKQWVKQLIRE